MKVKLPSSVWFVYLFICLSHSLPLGKITISSRFRHLSCPRHPSQSLVSSGVTTSRWHVRSLPIGVHVSGTPPPYGPPRFLPVPLVPHTSVFFPFCLFRSPSSPVWCTPRNRLKLQHLDVKFGPHVDPQTSNSFRDDTPETISVTISPVSSLKLFLFDVSELTVDQIWHLKVVVFNQCQTIL